MTLQATEKVQRSFTRSFRTYHNAANQQARIADRLVRDLKARGAPDQFASALELGCGTGHLTERLCNSFDFGSLTLNDLSQEAENTAVNYGASFLCGDASSVEWPDQPQLIASASMIQWLTDPALFLRRAAAALAPGGWLAISGFGPEQYTELVQLGSSAKAPGLCEPGKLAKAVQHDLEVLNIGEMVQQKHFTSPRKVLEHLRQTGVNGRAQKTWTKSTLQKFSDDYEQRFKGPAGVSLTYHPTWIIARKPA